MTSVERESESCYSALARGRFGRQQDEFLASIDEGFRRLARNSCHEHKHDWFETNGRPCGYDHPRQSREKKKEKEIWPRQDLSMGDARYPRNSRIYCSSNCGNVEANDCLSFSSLPFSLFVFLFFSYQNIYIHTYIHTSYHSLGKFLFFSSVSHSFSLSFLAFLSFLSFALSLCCPLFDRLEKTAGNARTRQSERTQAGEREREENSLCNQIK